MTARHRRWLYAGTTLVLSAGLSLQAWSGRPSGDVVSLADDVSETLARAGTQVEAFFTRAQSLMCTETVSITRLNAGLTTDGPGRTVESELRLSWGPGVGPVTEAKTQRQVIKVNGRPPRGNDHNNCTTPEQEDTETQPLSMLLPDRRGDYQFSMAGSTRIDGRAAVMIDFRELTKVSVDVRAVEGNRDCVSYELNGGLRGRLWLDRESSDVLRLDQRLAGLVDMRLPRALLRPHVEPIWTLERLDTSIRFGRVSFQEPDESLVLPLSSTTLSVTRGSGTPRQRTQTKYSNYKRFLTGARLVGN